MSRSFHSAPPFPTFVTKQALWGWSLLLEALPSHQYLLST